MTGWLAEEARRVAGPDAEIVAVNAASGLAAIETPEQAANAARAVEATIVAGHGARVAIIGGFGDPGLCEARARALMPVIGLGEAGMREAGRDGRRFSIVTLGAAMQKPIREKAKALGLGDALAQVRILPFSIAELVEDRQARADEIAEEIEACAAEFVLLGGAPFAGLARELAARTKRFVLDGVDAAVRDALMAL